MFAIVLFILVVLLAPVNPVMAHVEKGYMPDSVAEMEFRILLEFKPEDSNTRSLLGMALIRQNKLSEAENEFRLLLKTAPDNFDALDSLGLVLLKQKRLPEAIKYLKEALKLRPDDVMVHLHLGQSLSNTGQSESARTTLSNGIRLLNAAHLPISAKEKQLAEFQSAISLLPPPSIIHTK